MTFWNIIAFFWSGVFSLAIGVILGGVLVYATKRESFEALRLSPAAPGAINIDPFEDEVTEPDVIPDMFAAKNHEFISQLAKHKAVNKDDNNEEV